MLNVAARNWWMLAVRGILAIIFGILAFIWPGLVLTSLVILFGAYALVDGVFSIIEGIRERQTNNRWWAHVLEGIVGILAGLAVFTWPGMTELILLYIIAFWAIFTGVFEIISAIRLRKEIEGELWLGLAGLASIVFGVVMFLFPGAGAVSLVWLIGSYAILFGVLTIILAFRLRGMQDRLPPDRTHAPA